MFVFYIEATREDGKVAYQKIIYRSEFKRSDSQSGETEFIIYREVTLNYTLGKPDPANKVIVLELESTGSLPTLIDIPDHVKGAVEIKGDDSIQVLLDPKMTSLSMQGTFEVRFSVKFSG